VTRARNERMVRANVSLVEGGFQYWSRVFELSAVLYPLAARVAMLSLPGARGGRALRTATDELEEALRELFMLPVNSARLLKSSSSCCAATIEAPVVGSGISGPTAEAQGG
jgi:hypothetical protein